MLTKQTEVSISRPKNYEWLSTKQVGLPVVVWTEHFVSFLRKILSSLSLGI